MTSGNPADKAGQGEDSADLFQTGRLIKNTDSICPQCLEPVQAGVYQRHGQVWMDKQCIDHGCFSALLSSDIRHYYQAPEKNSGSQSCCGNACGAPLANAQDNAPAWDQHSCNVLIEITERCNLSCPTCFAGSSPQHSGMMSLEEFTRQVDQLVAGGKSGADVIQLSGGEPTIHPQLHAMIDVLIDRGFHQICINTNGIKLAQAAFARRLASQFEESGATLFAYLQFDGFEDSTNRMLRGRSDLLAVKQKALVNCQRLGIRVHPVMTLTRDINDHETGDFIRLAISNPFLKNVVIQPAMYSGRYENSRRVDRLTLADAVNLICQQTGIFEPEDFMPIPCSDPNCFGMAVALRTSSGLLPVSRYFPRYETWGSEESSGLIGKFTDTIDGPRAIGEAIQWAAENPEFLDLDDEEIDRLLGALIDWQTDADSADIWDSLLVVSIKPFMDAWTYDQDRVDQCCVHILDRDGNPVSFCEYNAINRPRMTARMPGSQTEILPLEVLT
jgi:uncharacterized radical SAM superfamily Fe-S cluster-containing enzyme